MPEGLIRRLNCSCPVTDVRVTQPDVRKIFLYEVERPVVVYEVWKLFSGLRFCGFRSVYLESG